LLPILLFVKKGMRRTFFKGTGSLREFITHFYRDSRIIAEPMPESPKPMTAKNLLPKRFTLIIALMLIVVLPLVLILPIAFAQSTTTTQSSAQASSSSNGLGLLAAGVAIAGSCAGAGYAVGKAASSAAAAIVERPATFGPLLILAGLGEGIAIYGLLVAFQILSKI
jgi:V/A-type H+/Na+-transporting ATPase subunit K